MIKVARSICGRHSLAGCDTSWELAADDSERNIVWYYVDGGKGMFIP